MRSKFCHISWIKIIPQLGKCYTLYFTTILLRSYSFTLSSIIVHYCWVCEIHWYQRPIQKTVIIVAAQVEAEDKTLGIMMELRGGRRFLQGSHSAESLQLISHGKHVHTRTIIWAKRTTLYCSLQRPTPLQLIILPPTNFTIIFPVPKLFGLTRCSIDEGFLLPLVLVLWNSLAIL